jgi:hypothetical protein
MSKSRSVLTPVELRRLGAVGPVRLRVFAGSGAPAVTRGGVRVYCRVTLALLLVVAGMVALATSSAFAAQAPKVEEESVSEVSATGATLQACVSSEGSEPVSYEFEYGTSLAYGASVQASANGGGTCSSGVSVRAHVQGLVAQTSYDYRMLASAGGETSDGAGQSFTTQPAGSGSQLPDARMWELVSPPVKDGALIGRITQDGGVIESAEGGSAFTYISVGPAKSGQQEPPANANDTQLLSIRGTDGGWSSQDIATPHEVNTGIAFGGGQEYKWFSPDLALGLVEPFGSGRTGEKTEGAAPLSEAASEKTLYLRADTPLMSLSRGALYLEAKSEGGYLPLVTGCPQAEECNAKVQSRADVLPGTKFGGEIKFLSATPNLDHVVFESLIPLIAKATGRELYEWTGGVSPKEQLRIVSILPTGAHYNGEEAPDAALGYGEGRDSSGAVSADGSRIVWSAREEHLFMRSMVAEQTVQLDVPENGVPSNKGEAKFQFASSDGSKVFFTDGERLTAGSTAEAYKPDLYVCEIFEVEEAGKEIPKCHLSDLTADGSESADVQGTVVPASDEGSYVYFVANGILAPGAVSGNCGGDPPPPGSVCNFYMRHYDEESKAWEPPTLIGVLSSEDKRDWETVELEKMSARVAPSGEFLTFMSDRSLTGYDNRDVNSGAADEEVYLYRAPSTVGAPGRLVCVSCNPTGERPSGVLDPAVAEKLDGLLVDSPDLWRGRWLAGDIPGWTPMALERAGYQSRYLSDSGRVFFNSPDSLVPQATNGLMDVFEYEPGGVGGCETSSDSFSASSDGCVGLISSGSAAEESAFLDASEDGDDAFFLTSSRLVPGDRDTAFDVYDAHVCSAAEPCSTEVAQAPPCETADSCRVAPLPQPSVFGAPASATFSGAGNPIFSPSSSVNTTSSHPILRCSKGKKPSHGRCVKGKAKRMKRKGRAGR